MDSGGLGGLETAEKNCVMVGWDGSAVLRLRLRDGRGWRRWRAAGLGGEMGVAGIVRQWGGNGIQGVLTVPYIPVQGSPGVFRKS